MGDAEVAVAAEPLLLSEPFVSEAVSLVASMQDHVMQAVRARGDPLGLKRLAASALRLFAKVPAEAYLLLAYLLLALLCTIAFSWLLWHSASIEVRPSNRVPGDLPPDVYGRTPPAVDASHGGNYRALVQRLSSALLLGDEPRGRGDSALSSALLAISNQFYISRQSVNGRTDYRAWLDAGAVPPLLASLAFTHIATTSRAAYLLGIFVSDSQDVAVAGQIAEQASIFAACLGGGGDGEQIYQCANLFRIAFNLLPPGSPLRTNALVFVPSFISLLGSADTLPLQGLTTRPYGADVAACALEALVFGARETADLVFDAGALKPLVRLFERRNGSDRFYVAKALGSMLGLARREHRNRALSLGAARLFAACLTSTDSDLVSTALKGLLAFVGGEAELIHAAFFDQLLVGCPSSCFADLLEAPGDDENVSASLIGMSCLHILSRSFSHHGQLIGERLLRAVIATPRRGDVADPSRFLATLLQGTHADEAAVAITTAGGIKFFVSEVLLDGAEAVNALLGLVAIKKASPALDAEVVAGAEAAGLSAAQLRKLLRTVDWSF